MSNTNPGDKLITLEGLNTYHDEMYKLVNNTFNVTWIELKNKRDSSELVPGQQYRITDYVTTTVQSNTQSMGHQFDIIVTADSETKLNENAKAIQHTNDEEDYFANYDLSVWEIKYCLYNDSDRFAWADTENGTGVIYYMKDEWNNECPYDFKNIQFKHPNDTTTYPLYYYTFSYILSGVVCDNSLRSGCYNNVIKEHLSSNSNMIMLNNIVFINPESTMYKYYNNHFDVNCYNNSFGKYCCGNMFEHGCYNNSFGNNCSDNSFGNNCYRNAFGNNCYNNSFGDYCRDNSFGNNCYRNAFGNSCANFYFDNEITYGTFEHYINTNNVVNDTILNNIISNSMNNKPHISQKQYNSNNYLCLTYNDIHVDLDTLKPTNNIYNATRGNCHIYTNRSVSGKYTINLPEPYVGAEFYIYRFTNSNSYITTIQNNSSNSNKPQFQLIKTGYNGTGTTMGLSDDGIYKFEYQPGLNLWLGTYIG